MLLCDMFGRKTIVFHHESSIVLVSWETNWNTEGRLPITNGKMSAKIRQSDFRDCTPISPSKKEKKVSQEIAPPQRASSSDNEVEDSLVSCC